MDMTQLVKTHLMRVKQAAEKYNIPERDLWDLIEATEITLYTLDYNGERDWLVERDQVACLAAKRFIKRENFSILDGTPIGISEAGLKYGFHVGTISQWVDEGHIKEIGPDPSHKQRRLINEADVAYAAALRDIKGLRSGRSLWD